MGYYEKPEMMGLRVMNFIMNELNIICEYRIYFVHELEMILCYNFLKYLKIHVVTKREKIKYLFSDIDKNIPSYNTFIERIEKFEFDVDVKILLEKENGEWKDITTLDMNSTDVDVASWGGFFDFSDRMHNIIKDLQEYASKKY